MLGRTLWNQVPGPVSVHSDGTLIIAHDSGRAAAVVHPRLFGLFSKKYCS